MNRGLVGPTRQFGPSGVYNYFMFAMLIGALAPIPFWLWQRRFPDTRLKFINLPVLLNGPTLAPPANGINYTSFFIVGFIFRAYLFCVSDWGGGWALGEAHWSTCAGLAFVGCWRERRCLVGDAILADLRGWTTHVARTKGDWE